MDPGSLLSGIAALLGWLSGLPGVGKVVAYIVSASVALILVVNSLVAVWHAAVTVVNAIAQIPGLSGLQGIADAMKADESVIDDFANSKLLPILNQISGIPLPSNPSPQVKS